MKTATILISLFLLSSLPFAAFADPYDKTAVVASMRANAARLGAVKSAVAAQDFFAAAQAFFDYGKEAADMQKMDPPKGSKEEWVKIWKSFQDTAFIGVGACGERDAAKALKALDGLVALNKAGHPAFR